MKIKHLSILLLLVLLLSSCGPSMESSLDEANELVLEGKFEEAEQIYLELIEKHKDENQPYLKLGQLYLLKSDFNKAEKYLMSIDEESGELATSLIKLAGDSNNMELLNETFNKYKEKDMIKENKEFFENLILAYSKFNEGEKIKESIDKLENLKLKLDPQVIEKAYSTLLASEMEDLANLIIRKDIYNKEIGDLSLIPEIIEEKTNKELINLTSGYFISPDRLDIALLYGIDYSGYYPELEIVLVNGLNGQVISSLKEETINAYMNIDSFDTSGNGDDILSLWGHAGGSGTPSTIELYRFKDNNFIKIEYGVESDREIIFKDNFEYKVSSEKLDKNYLMQVYLGDIPYYISEEIYNQEGKLLIPQEDMGSGYEHEYTISNLSSGDYVYHSLGLWDTYDNKSYLGEIKSYFKLQEDKLVLVDLVVEDGQGNPKPFNYKEVEGYEELDFTDLDSKKEDLEDFLKVYLELFKETENTIKNRYGKPLVEDYYGVKYLKYDDFIVFVSPMDSNELVSSVWTNDLLGLDNNTETIIRIFGLPEYSGYDEEEMEDYMGYSIDGYYVTFTDIGEEYPYVKIKAK